MTENNCGHFWELNIESLKDEIPEWECMNCGTKKRDKIPVLDTRIFEGIEGELDV